MSGIAAFLADSAHTTTATQASCYQSADVRLPVVGLQPTWQAVEAWDVVHAPASRLYNACIVCLQARKKWLSLIPQDTFARQSFLAECEL